MVRVDALAPDCPPEELAALKRQILACQGL
jgi:hypothetical protein